MTPFKEKNILEMELFPITADGVTFHVTYTVLKEWVREKVATRDEIELFREVEPIFEPVLIAALS